MAYNLLAQKKDLTPKELSILDIELRRCKKSPTVLWLLWLFTGAFGGHRYYLGDKKRAIAHSAVFLLALVVAISYMGAANVSIIPSIAMVRTQSTLTSALPFLLQRDFWLHRNWGHVILRIGIIYLLPNIPVIWAVIDAFFINQRLSLKNAQIESQIINQIKKMRS